MATNQSTDDWRVLSEDLTSTARGIFGTTGLILAFTGILGNFFVCFAVFRTKMMRNSTNILIANLALADLLQSLNMIPITVTLFSGEWYFGKVGCEISGYVMMSMIFAGTYILGLISLNRYSTVNHGNNRRAELFTIKRTCVIVSIVWVFALIVSSPPLYGFSWAAYVLYRRRSVCSLLFHTHSTYFIIYSANLMLPAGMIAYFYWKIFKILKRSRRTVHDITESNERNVRYWKGETSNSQISVKIVAGDNDKDVFSVTEHQIDQQIATEANHVGYSINGNSSMASVTIMLFIIVVIFVIVYMPTFIVNIINLVKPEYIPNVWMDMSFVMLALSNHSINPLVYGLMNRQYRKVFKHYCIVC